MKNNKWLMWGLIGFTIILLITAVILFLQLKKPSTTTPPLASPRPKASPTLPTVQQTEPENVCEVSFTVTAPASPSPSPSVSPSPSPSPEPITCFDTCDSDSQCETDLRCMAVGGDKRCVNAECTSETDCTCATEAPPSPSPSSSPIAYIPPPAAPTPPAELTKGGQPELPEAGFAGPAVLGISAGLLMIIFGLLF